VADLRFASTGDLPSCLSLRAFVPPSLRPSPFVSAIFAETLTRVLPSGSAKNNQVPGIGDTISGGSEPVRVPYTVWNFGCGPVRCGLGAGRLWIVDCGLRIEQRGSNRSSADYADGRRGGKQTAPSGLVKPHLGRLIVATWRKPVVAERKNHFSFILCLGSPVGATERLSDAPPGLGATRHGRIL